MTNPSALTRTACLATTLAAGALLFATTGDAHARSFNNLVIDLGAPIGGLPGDSSKQTRPSLIIAKDDPGDDDDKMSGGELAAPLSVKRPIKPPVKRPIKTLKPARETPTKIRQLQTAPRLTSPRPTIKSPSRGPTRR